MGQIEWKRVLFGGIVAGLIMDVVDWFFNGIVLGPWWREVMTGLGHPVYETGPRIAFFVLLGMAYGLLAVWFYASVRPRYGAGPKTALIAGLGVWLLGNVLPTMIWVPMGLFPKRLLALAMLVGLVGIMTATLVGSWLYQEQPKS